MENDNYKPIFATFLMIASSICFVFSGIAVKIVSSNVDNYTIVFFRNLVSTFILLPFVLKSLHGKDFLKPNKLHILRAIFSSLGVYFYFLAISIIDLSNAVLLQFTSPLFIPVLALLFFKIPIKRQAILAASIGFFGVAIVLQVNTLSFNFGSLSGLMSGFFSALAIMTIWKLVGGESVSKIVFMYSAFGTIIMLPYWVYSGQDLNFNNVTILTLVGFFSLAAQLLYTYALTQNHPDLVITVSYTGVVWAAIIGFFYWGEDIEVNTIVGGSIIVIACIMTSRIQKKL